jgi:hypothetical protein
MALCLLILLSPIPLLLLVPFRMAGLAAEVEAVEEVILTIATEPDEAHTTTPRLTELGRRRLDGVARLREKAAKSGGAIEWRKSAGRTEKGEIERVYGTACR